MLKQLFITALLSSTPLLDANSSNEYAYTISDYVATNEYSETHVWNVDGDSHEFLVITTQVQYHCILSFNDENNYSLLCYKTTFRTWLDGYLSYGYADELTKIITIEDRPLYDSGTLVNPINFNYADNYYFHIFYYRPIIDYVHGEIVFTQYTYNDYDVNDNLDDNNITTYNSFAVQLVAYDDFGNDTRQYMGHMRSFVNYNEQLINPLKKDISSYLYVVENYSLPIDYDMVYTRGFNDGVNSSPKGVFALVGEAFEPVGSFLGFEIAPNITIGLLLAIPLCITIIIFVFKIVGS